VLLVCGLTGWVNRRRRGPARGTAGRPGGSHLEINEAKVLSLQLGPLGQEVALADVGPEVVGVAAAAPGAGPETNVA
jgi:hypothetical protein